ncbi:MAG: hypothetical protein RLZZ437_17 [Pseudomonadota bacterium]|jgi:hypothetical protein
MALEQNNMTTHEEMPLSRWKPVLILVAGAASVLLVILAMTHALILFPPWDDRFSILPVFGGLGGLCLAFTLYFFGPSATARALSSPSDGISLIATIAAGALGAFLGFLVPYAGVAVFGGPVAHELTGRVMDTNYGTTSRNRSRFGLFGPRSANRCQNPVAFSPDEGEKMYLCLNSGAEKATVLANGSTPVTFVFTGWGNDIGLSGAMSICARPSRPSDCHHRSYRRFGTRFSYQRNNSTITPVMHR